jgi:hypothetical protein
VHGGNALGNSFVSVLESAACAAVMVVSRPPNHRSLNDGFLPEAGQPGRSTGTAGIIHIGHS